MPRVRSGLENLIASPPGFLQHQRLGLLCNPASVDGQLVHSRYLINDRFPGQMTALFSPQHGFFSEKQDNMVESDHIQEPQLGIPVYSLYGKTRIPTREMLNNIDVLIVDLQDVGTRVYTFIYTISYCLEAAKRAGKKVLILDRPNPINGAIIEGNLLNQKWSSFVGRYEIPMRHGLTVAELARFINNHYEIEADLSIIPMTAWYRDMFFGDTKLPWVSPSPNLPTITSTFVYPGQVLWEGTNVSEGRGTCLPFEQFGAPYIDSEKVLDYIGGRRQPGVILRPVAFEPVANKWKGSLCQGFQIHVTDLWEFNPYRLTLQLLQAVLALHPDEFKYKTPPYEYEYKRRPIDLIIGDPAIRRRLEAGEPMGEISASWRPQLESYHDISQPFLIYDAMFPREIR